LLFKRKLFLLQPPLQAASASTFLSSTTAQEPPERVAEGRGRACLSILLPSVRQKRQRGKRWQQSLFLPSEKEGILHR